MLAPQSDEFRSVSSYHSRFLLLMAARVHPAGCKVAISLRRDVARPNLLPVKPRLIVAGAWPNDLFDENKADGSPPRRAFVTAERDGYFLIPPANRIVHSAAQTSRSTIVVRLVLLYARNRAFVWECVLKCEPTALAAGLGASDLTEGSPRLAPSAHNIHGHRFQNTF